MEEFRLEEHEFIALCNLMQVTGMSPSGGMAKMAIADGQVRVDGRVELRKRCKIKAGQIVAFDGNQIKVV